MEMAEESFDFKASKKKLFRDAEFLENEFVREKEDFYTTTLNLTDEQREKILEIEKKMKENFVRQGVSFGDVDLCMLREMGSIESGSNAFRANFRDDEEDFDWKLKKIIGKSKLFKYKKWCKTYAEKVSRVVVVNLCLFRRVWPEDKRGKVPENCEANG